MLRLFVAIRPPAAMRHHLLTTMHGVSAARWQSDAQLHLTLAFIGEVDEATAETIDTALATVSAEPVPLGIAGVGCFADKGRATALWAAATPSATLAVLAAKVNRAIARAGPSPTNRAYVPHITLARLNRSSGPPDGWLAVHAGLSISSAPAISFGLYESRLGKGGSAYNLLAEYRLVGR